MTITAPITAPTVELRVLGTPSVTRAGRATKLHNKAIALLAYLALEGRTPRRYLATLLWPAAPDALNNLAVTKNHIITELGQVLESNQEQLSLNQNLVSDVSIWLSQPDQSTWSLYQGEFLQHLRLREWKSGLGEEFEEWIEQQRARLAQMRLDRALGFGNSAIKQANWPAAEHWLAIASSDNHNPSEEASRKLLLLAGLAGRGESAATVFMALEQNLQASGVGKASAITRQALVLAQSNNKNACLLALRPQPAQPIQSNPATAELTFPLVGRSREWAQMEAAWQLGQTILISGLPGVGKSRLAQQFAASKGTVFKLWGRPGDGAVPYSSHARVFAQVLDLQPDVLLPNWVRREVARILPQLGESPTPITNEGDKLRFYDAKLKFYQNIAPDGWNTQFFDDVQFIDAASTEAGIYLHSQLLPYQPGFPRTIFVFRAGELESWHEKRLRDLVTAGLAVWLDLEPLDTTAIAQFLGHLDAGAAKLDHLAPALAQLTGGNPLLLLETVRSMLEVGVSASGNHLDLPRSSKAIAITQERLARLSRPALRLAWLAAICGEAFDLDLAQSVLDSDLDTLLASLEELERASVLRGLRFSHDLIFEATLANVPASVALLFHSRVLDLLSAKAAPAALQLVHAEGAKRWPAAFDLACQAAQNAHDLFLRRDAALFIEKALALVEKALVHPPAAIIADLLRQLANLQATTAPSDLVSVSMAPPVLL
jgi:DNA-binding SARP family transcriptional activator